MFQPPLQNVLGVERAQMAIDFLELVRRDCALKGHGKVSGCSDCAAATLA